MDLFLKNNTLFTDSTSNTTIFGNETTNRYELQDNALVVSLLINTGLSLLILLVFCILRKRFKLFYQYRAEKRQNGIIRAPGTGFFSWIKDTYKYNSENIIEISGLDSYFYLRNVKTNFKILLTLMIIGWVMLFPTNSKGRYNENRKVQQDGTLPDQVIGLSTLSMGNIERGSNLLWVHFIFVFIVTLVVMIFTFIDYKDYTDKRIQYRKSKRLLNYTILLRDIPVNLFSKQSLKEYFQQFLINNNNNNNNNNYLNSSSSSLSSSSSSSSKSMLNNSIIDISLQYPIPNIHSLIDEREYYVKRYDSVVAEYNKSRVRPSRKSGLFGLYGKRIDSIDYYNGRINDIEVDIQDTKTKAERDYQDLMNKEKLRQESNDDGDGDGDISSEVINSLKSAGNGFIIVKERNSQKELVQTIIEKRDGILLKRYYAPDPNDVYWPNIHFGGKQVFIRGLVIMVLTFLLIFFYTIPITFISGFSNLGTLAKIKAFSWLVTLINKSPTLTSFLTGFLPGLALMIFLALLVPILTMFSRFSGYYSKSDIEASVFSKYFLFLVFNVFLVSAIAGTIFQSIGAIIDNPPSITTTLANSLGGLSYAMINYVLLAATGLTMNLLRISDLLVGQFKLKFICKTKRDIQDTESTDPFKYGQLYAYNLLVLQLCFAYSTLSPFILVFGVWYFGVSYLVHKYNIVWVNKPHITQLLYPMSFRRTMIALLIYHLLMIGTFNVYSFYYGSLILIPFFLTILFWVYCEYTFYSVSKNGLLDHYQSSKSSNKKSQLNSINNNNNNNNKSNLNEKSSLLQSKERNNYIDIEDGNHFNDTCYSIDEYDENLYKPVYYRSLMEPEESIIDSPPIISHSKPPEILNQ
ncbi:hypothetical protein ACTFIW_011555 [Dictyostelium discoideum]